MEIHEEEEEEKMFLEDLENQKHFELKMFIEDDKIHFWLKEDKIFAPYTYEKSFTFQEFVERHKIFSACEDLKEILSHLKKIYKKNKLILEEEQKKAEEKKNEEIDLDEEKLEKIKKEKEDDYDKLLICLQNCGAKKYRYLHFKVDNISEYRQKTDDFILQEKMTENKDQDLKRLYDIQKYQIDALKNIKKILSTKVSKEAPLYKAIMEQIKLSKAKI
jgi:hypothetical protein